MTAFAEVSDRVWVARHEWFDLNVTVVAGSRGLLVVDTHASALAAAEVVESVRRLGAGGVIAVVNTHEHFDHTFGNGTFRAAWPGLEMHAHEVAAANTVAAGERVKAEYHESRRFADPDPRCHEVIDTEIVPADLTFSSARVLDLGDRAVELVYPGRGHTAGDLVVRVPDSDVLVAGDLVEESAPPAFGPDSWPFDWPASVDLVLSLLTDASVVVPGHGAVVDRAFVRDQRADLGMVAETIRDLAGRGVPVDQALAAADWPYPAECLVEAVRRGYAQLPPGGRRLPLL